MILLTFPNPGALPAFIVATITLVIVVVAVLAFRMEKFKKRIAQHIVDGILLLRNRMPHATSDEYWRVANDWVNKVASDIRKHRGQSEANNFLIEWRTKQSDSMDRIQDMLRNCIDWLQWFQMRCR